MHAAAVVDDVVVVHGERTLTDLDHSRLIRLGGHRLPSVLDDLLAQADITSSRTVRADVVTMYSRVELLDVHTRRLMPTGDSTEMKPAAGSASCG